MTKTKNRRYEALLSLSLSLSYVYSLLGKAGPVTPMVDLGVESTWEEFCLDLICPLHHQRSWAHNKGARRFDQT